MKTFQVSENLYEEVDFPVKKNEIESLNLNEVRKQNDEIKGKNSREINSQIDLSLAYSIYHILIKHRNFSLAFLFIVLIFVFFNFIIGIHSVFKTCSKN